MTAALLVAGEPFGFMCILGYLGLPGMIIENAVVLIDQINIEISSGKQPYPAILDSAVSRLRPDTAAAYDAAALGAEALTARPLMRLLDNGLTQLGITVKLAKSAWYPTVALVGQYEQSGDNPLATNNDYANDYYASITARFQWKFRTGGKTRADVAGARQKTRALEAGIEGYRNQIYEEVQGAVLDCQAASGNIETAEKALAHAKESWRITDLQYQQQTALASDVLDARTFLSQADANYFRSVYGYLNAVAGLERAIGGRRITAEGGP